VWPADGVYCLATPFVIPKSDPPKRVYAHKTFDNVSDAVSFVLNQRSTKDLFFAVHTLKEHSVFNPEKTNLKTGEMGAPEVRVQRNMKASRAFFFDLDVGPDPQKYSSQSEAVMGLRKFCEATELPKPLITSSGGGLHVYWIVVDPIDSDAWKEHAAKLRQLAHHYGLKIDNSRTTDTASVLRVAGTFNLKDRANPREVKTLSPLPGQPVSETGTGAFIQMLDEAIIKAGVTMQAPPKFAAQEADDILGTNTVREFEGPPVSLKALLLSCGQMRRLALSKGQYSEPEWYHGVIGVGRFLEDGHRRVQQMSEGHPSYSHAAVQEKVRQHEKRRDNTGRPLGPTGCAKLLEVSGPANEHICTACPFKKNVEAGKIHGPIGAAKFKDPAPAPQVMELLSGVAEPVTITIPDPPPPFVRLKGGGIAVYAEDADGNKDYTTIYEHDLFPIRRLSNLSQGLEQQVWHVTLPRGESKDFTLDADMLYDTRKFVTAIANQGVYPHKGNLPGLQEYMVAYIAQLQKLVDADAQHNHLGWTDDFHTFIFPDKLLSADGTAKPAQLSIGAQRATAHVRKGGDINKQVELLRFYNDPKYRAHQFFVLAGLAAPIFFATGHHGVIVNASGNAGASKSTALYTAASFWGQPELYPINGTNNGATVRGRNERVATLANLPVCVDEITHMPAKDAVDLAMSITQPGHRIRLDTTGIERANLESYKATIMLTTANNSLHVLLSTDNAAGTAGSMRVFEMLFKPTGVHTKAQADDYLHDLKQNFGHLGELFVAYVMKNLPAIQYRVRELVREIDAACNIQSSERYWSGTIAAVLVAGEIAQQLGFISYDLAALKQWAIEEQVPEMRGIVKEEYSDPLGILTDYLETVSANMLVMEKMNHAQQNLVNVKRRPVGSLLAHYDTDDNVLYVLKKGFKDYCTKIGANSRKIIDELHAMREGQRIIVNTNTRRTLGAGTEFAKAQSWVFIINMSHKDVTGAVDLQLVTGGGLGGEDAGDKPALTVVT
jgi:hypothetical protein